MSYDSKNQTITVNGETFHVEEETATGYPLVATYTIEELPSVKGELIADEDPQNPRKDFDNFGVLGIFGTIARDYDLGGSNDISVSDSEFVRDWPYDILDIDCERCEGTGDDPERWGIWRGHGNPVAAGSEEAMNIEFDRMVEREGDHSTVLHMTPVSCLRCKGEGQRRATLTEYLKREHDAVVIIGVHFADYGSGGMRCWTTDIDDDEPGNNNGVIFATKAQIKTEFGDSDIDAPLNDHTRRAWGDNPPATRRESIERLLKGEVETLSQYLEQDIYGYNVEGCDDPFDSSLWGLYGHDYAKDELFSALETAVTDRINKRNELMAETLGYN